LLSRSGTVTEPVSPPLHQKALCLLKMFTSRCRCYSIYRLEHWLALIGCHWLQSFFFLKKSSGSRQDVEKGIQSFMRTPLILASLARLLLAPPSVKHLALAILEFNLDVTEGWVVLMHARSIDSSRLSVSWIHQSLKLICCLHQSLKLICWMA
jgi:hypothetical protein